MKSPSRQKEEEERMEWRGNRFPCHCQEVRVHAVEEQDTQTQHGKKNL